MFAWIMSHIDTIPAHFLPDAYGFQSSDKSWHIRMSHVTYRHNSLSYPIRHIRLPEAQIVRNQESEFLFSTRELGTFDIWHDSFICFPHHRLVSGRVVSQFWRHTVSAPRLIHIWHMTHSHVFHSMTHSYVWHGSFIFVTWLIYSCDMTHSYVWRHSFIYVTWLIHTCDMTHSRAWHVSFICVTWLIHVWHDLFICETWLIRT